MKKVEEKKKGTGKVQNFADVPGQRKDDKALKNMPEFNTDDTLRCKGCLWLCQKFMKDGSTCKEYRNAKPETSACVEYVTDWTPDGKTQVVTANPALVSMWRQLKKRSSKIWIVRCNQASDETLGGMDIPIVADGMTDEGWDSYNRDILKGETYVLVLGSSGKPSIIVIFDPSKDHIITIGAGATAYGEYSWEEYNKNGLKGFSQMDFIALFRNPTMKLATSDKDEGLTLKTLLYTVVAAVRARKAEGKGRKRRGSN